jgi:hypothetical protein
MERRRLEALTQAAARARSATRSARSAAGALLTAKGLFGDDAQPSEQSTVTAEAEGRVAAADAALALGLPGAPPTVVRLLVECMVHSLDFCRVVLFSLRRLVLVFFSFLFISLFVRFHGQTRAPIFFAAFCKCTLAPLVSFQLVCHARLFCSFLFAKRATKLEDTSLRPSFEDCLRELEGPVQREVAARDYGRTSIAAIAAATAAAAAAQSFGGRMDGQGRPLAQGAGKSASFANPARPQTQGSNSRLKGAKSFGLTPAASAAAVPPIASETASSRSAILQRQASQAQREAEEVEEAAEESRMAARDAHLLRNSVAFRANHPPATAHQAPSQRTAAPSGSFAFTTANPLGMSAAADHALKPPSPPPQPSAAALAAAPAVPAKKGVSFAQEEIHEDGRPQAADFSNV